MLLKDYGFNAFTVLANQTTQAPVYKTNVINTQPALLTTDGTGAYYNVTTMSFAKLLSDSCSEIFIVYKFNTPFAAGYVSIGDGGTGLFRMDQYSSATVQRFGQGTNTSQYFSYPTHTMGSVFVEEVKKIGLYPEASCVKVLYNDSAVTVTSTSLKQKLNLSGSALTIPRNANTQAMYLFEIMIFKKPLSTTRRATVVAYLKSKYGTIP